MVLVSIKDSVCYGSEKKRIDRWSDRGSGYLGIARTTGASLSPVATGPLLANAALMNMPFFLSGGLKIIYDLMLYRSFKAIKPPEEK